MTTTTIDGFTLSAAQVVAVARNQNIEVNLAASSRAALKESRDYIESTWMHDEAPMMYSFNTGVGMLKDTRVKVADINLFQTQLIKAHAEAIKRFYEDKAFAVRAFLTYDKQEQQPEVERVYDLYAKPNAFERVPYILAGAVKSVLFGKREACLTGMHKGYDEAIGHDAHGAQCRLPEHNKKGNRRLL